MGNLGATPVLKRSWLGQDEFWFLANSQPRLRWRAATLAGGNFDFLILRGQLSGLVLLPDWDVLVLSVNTFTAAGLSIVDRSGQVRIPFSVQATAVNDAEAGPERHGHAICCCPGY